MPEISVVIPVYNTQKNLTRCINSILDQSFTGFELILVDDGSPDNSGEICDNFALRDSRVKVIHQKNLGASAARNIGVSVSNGKYICFVDSDDYVDGVFLDKLITAISNSDSDMCMCSYFFAPDNSKAVAQIHPFSNITLNSKKQIEEKLLKKVICVQDTTGLFSPCLKLFKKSIIAKNSIAMDENMSFGEDMLFVLSYIDHCEKISFIEDPLYYYNQSENGLFSKYRPSFLHDIMKCYVNLKCRANKLCLPEAYLPLSLKYRYYIERHIIAGIKAEKHKFRFVLGVYKNKDVRDVFRQIVSHSEEVLKSESWSRYELRLPKLISMGFLVSATIYSMYQYDDNNLLRKIIGFLRKS